MLVKNRYGGVQNLPDRVARYLVAVGTVSAVAAVKPEPTPEPQPEPRTTDAPAPRRGRPPKAE